MKEGTKKVYDVNIKKQGHMKKVEESNKKIQGTYKRVKESNEKIKEISNETKEIYEKKETKDIRKYRKVIRNERRSASK